MYYTNTAPQTPGYVSRAIQPFAASYQPSYLKMGDREDCTGNFTITIDGKPYQVSVAKADTPTAAPVAAAPVAAAAPAAAAPVAAPTPACGRCCPCRCPCSHPLLLPPVRPQSTVPCPAISSRWSARLARP